MSVHYYKNRIQKVQENMRKEKIDLLIVTPSPSLYYLTGYHLYNDERFLALVLPGNAEPFFIGNKIHNPPIPYDVLDDIVFWKDGESAFQLLFSEIQKRKLPIKKVSLEHTMKTSYSLQIMQNYKNTEFALSDSIIEPCRIYKDELEYAYVKKAVQMTEDALSELISQGTDLIGKSEIQVQAELLYLFRKRGLQADGACVAVGANAAFTHHIPSEKKIEEGNCLLIDCGAFYRGYASDMTRTFFFGEPDDEFKKVYDIVQEAERRSADAFQAGNLVEDAEYAAREYIKSQGYGDYFTHIVSHGLGLDIHEAPKSTIGLHIPLQKGVLSAIEPGIYLPGKFGVRIEDDYFINENNTERLQTMTKDLIVIR